MNKATLHPPFVRVTVRGGAAIDVTATIPIHVIIEDWDCPDSTTGEVPYRHLYLSDETLSASQATKYRRLAREDSSSELSGKETDEGRKP